MKSTASPYDDFPIICTSVVKAIFKLWPSKATARNTPGVFMCCGECHVEKWKTKVHIEASTENKTVDGATLLYECSTLYLL